MSKRKKNTPAKKRSGKKRVSHGVVHKVSSHKETTFHFKDGSHGTHLDQEKKMKHEDYPLFLRIGYEEKGERINK